MKKILLLIGLLVAVFSGNLLAELREAETVEKKLPRLVDFGAKQCKACKAMETVLESCMKKHADKFQTEFIDVWIPENQALAKSHQIQSIPTQIFFNEEGKELFRHTGFISEEDILARWQELGFVFARSETESGMPANRGETTAESSADTVGSKE